MEGFEGKKFGCIRTPQERLDTVPHIFSDRYLATPGQLPLIADICDYQSAWKLQMQSNGMLGNDNYGDCVIVALKANGPGTQQANSTGKLLSFTEDQVLADYSAITGFNKNDPNTDNGTDPLDALNYYKNKGAILAYGQVSLSNPAHLAAACNLYGGIFLATDVPQSWESSSLWGVTNQNTDPIVGGHGIWLPGYDTAGNFALETWAELVTITLAAIQKYGQAVYAVITPQWWAANSQSLQGFNLAQLQADLALVA